MIIVVEGPDNSGKTTLAQRLAKDFKGLYLKSNVRPVTRKVVRGFGFLTRQIETYFSPLILDRHHAISECIYGTILRNGHDLDAFECTLMCRNLNVVYCRPPESHVCRWRDDIPQLPGVKENADRIVAEYDRVFSNKFLFRRLMTYSWPDEPYPLFLERFQEEMLK